MAINPIKGGHQVDVQPGGRGGKRIRKTFKHKSEAVAYERHVLAQVQSQPDWTAPKKDARKLSDLVNIWYEAHGVNLSDGAGRKSILLNICKAVSDPRAELVTTKTFTDYRSKRMAEGLAANTANRHHAYVRAVFNELIRLGQWKRENPVSKLRAIKIQETELSYLNFEEMSELLRVLDTAINPHIGMMARVCLETGARWQEAASLRLAQVKNGTLQFSQTKSGKTRAVPVREKLVEQLEAHHNKHGNGERYFDDSATKWAFREAVKKTSLKLPKGQLTHVLRHTYASHIIMGGGNIVGLQTALGHQSIRTTMRYAHVSKDHLKESLTLNPLATLDAKVK